MYRQFIILIVPAKALRIKCHTPSRSRRSGRVGIDPLETRGLEMAHHIATIYSRAHAEGVQTWVMLNINI